MPALASVSDNTYNRSQGKGDSPRLHCVNNVEAGREACHGGRSGPPRLWPAVPLSCPSPQRTKPTQGGRRTWRGGRRFVEYSCHSAPHNLGVWREGRPDTETDRRTETKRQIFTLMLLSSDRKHYFSFLFFLLTLCLFLGTAEDWLEKKRHV